MRTLFEPIIIASLIIVVVSLIGFCDGKFERIGFVSDPVKLLLQDSYSSLKNRMYSQKESGWKKPMSYRQIRKRKFISFPPTFYSSYDIGALPFNSRRSVVLPYNDLFFSG